MTDREIIGDLPDELLGKNGHHEKGDFNFEDGRPRTLQGETLISTGRAVTVAGPAFLRPNTGDPGEHIALRLYQKALLQSELFLNVEDVVSASKKYSSGHSSLASPRFPGTLEFERQGSVICVRKTVEVSGENSMRPVTNEVKLTKSEMTSFAQRIASSLV